MRHVTIIATAFIVTITNVNRRPTGEAVATVCDVAGCPNDDSRKDGTHRRWSGCTYAAWKGNCSTATAIATITITITIIKTTPPASCTPPKPAHPNQLHYITYHHLNQLQYDSPSLFDSGPHDLQWRVEPVSHLQLGFRVFNRKVDRTCDNRKRVAYSVCVG